MEHNQICPNVHLSVLSSHPILFYHSKYPNSAKSTIKATLTTTMPGTNPQRLQSHTPTHSSPAYPLPMYDPALRTAPEHLPTGSTNSSLTALPRIPTDPEANTSSQSGWRTWRKRHPGYWKAITCIFLCLAFAGIALLALGVYELLTKRCCT